MALPQMGKVLKRKEQPITIITTTQTIVGVKPTITEVETPLRAVVQVASSEILKALNIQYSQSFYQVHIRQELLTKAEIGIKTIDKITDYKNRSFTIYDIKDYSEYGYIEFICEEIKE